MIVNAKITTVLVLGCNMQWLQQDRIKTALELSKQFSSYDKSDIYWYLSGGVKNALEQKITEADQMKQSIEKTNSCLDIGTIVLDTTATNTAENFRNFANFVNGLNQLDNYDLDIIVVTSKFHKARAEKFFYGFFSSDIIPQWKLSPLECSTCATDELFHMKNVDADINKAKNVF